jgi:hypothetical protein
MNAEELRAHKREAGAVLAALMDAFLIRIYRQHPNVPPTAGPRFLRQ